MRRLVAMLSLAALAACASGQGGGGDPEPQEMEEVFRHYFNAPGPEQQRVALQPGFYRAEIDQGGVQFSLRPMEAGVQVPMVRDLLMGTDVQGGRTLEVQVYAAADYMIRVTGGAPGRQAEVVLKRIVGKTEP